MTTGPGTYAVRTNALRETAKWLAAIFAGTGAILFSGLSFTNLEKAAASDHWVLPVLFAAVPVITAAVVVGGAARVISKHPPTWASLFPDQSSQGMAPASRKLREAVENLAPATVATYGGLTQFERRLGDVRVRIGETEKSYESDRSVSNRKLLEAEYEKLAVLQDGVADLLLCAEFVQVDKLYRRTRWLMLFAALIGVGGAAASGVATGQGSARSGEEARAASVTSPLEVHVYLLAGAPRPPCPVGKGQAATAIGGTLTQPLLLFPATGPSNGEGGDCTSPWIWTAPETGVVVVPANGGGPR
ncbi:MAG TPA: hypothetical protein VGL47_43530 [Amycolatopsis sp.]|uniref:hypothetical protein n=1 Tax=Amycolatopsis sp. TaxID=37632 RepID=UPI002F4247A9